MFSMSLFCISFRLREHDHESCVAQNIPAHSKCGALGTPAAIRKGHYMAPFLCMHLNLLFPSLSVALLPPLYLFFSAPPLSLGALPPSLTLPLALPLSLYYSISFWSLPLFVQHILLSNHGTLPPKMNHSATHCPSAAISQKNLLIWNVPLKIALYFLCRPLPLCRPPSSSPSFRTHCHLL